MNQKDEPIPGAAVRVWDLDWMYEIYGVQTTDEEGRFDLPAVRPHHPLKLVVRPVGLVPTVVDRVLVKGTKDDLEIRIPEGGTLKGIVKDHLGKPLAKQTVHLLRAGALIPPRKNVKEWYEGAEAELKESLER